MEGIAALKTHYCEWLDGKEWDRWSALFTEDAVMQVGPDAASAVHGRSAIRRLLTRQLKQSKTKHVARNPEIDEEEPGRIRVVWEMTDRVETPLYLLEGAGFYEDRYVRTEDGWKIASVRLHRSKVELRPKSLIMRAILWMHNNDWLGRLSASADRTLGEALYVGLAPGERP
jgi:3-phenylpropionate/cinnamic acid dioxygenase small subunit